MILGAFCGLWGLSLSPGLGASKPGIFWMIFGRVWWFLKHLGLLVLKFRAKARMQDPCLALPLPIPTSPDLVPAAEEHAASPSLLPCAAALAV